MKNRLKTAIYRTLAAGALTYVGLCGYELNKASEEMTDQALNVYAEVVTASIDLQARAMATGLVHTIETIDSIDKTDN